ncbi:MAG: transposase [Porticoccus sp.]
MSCHVISRGNNRDACFYTDDYYLFYLGCLNDACHKHHVSVHAYVLMINHVHLMMASVDEMDIPQVVQSIGRRYVQYINKTPSAFGYIVGGAGTRQAW